MATIPGHGWTDLKRELMSKWHELTENDIDSTQGSKASLMDLLERKIGMKIEDASERIEEMAERYHLYEEPEETQRELSKQKKERVLELSPSPEKESERDIPKTP
ncbi:transcriptional regulator [Bdellovibrio sp. NC01]|uniref:transcriptional regulator n=1 Tax=Bdellovibrio sp. NC01 TaxID=2220073 RepID=UPI001FEE5F9B|nr:transcriptional regulator [Bdellovibrio sp. NC01]